MRNGPDSLREQSINCDLSQRTDTLLAKPPLEKQQSKRTQTSLANTNDMPKSFRNKNRSGCPSTQYGTMPLNYFRAHLAPYQDAYYPSRKRKLQKQRSSLRNTCDEILSDRHGAPTQPTSFSSKRRMANSDRFKISVRSINRQKKNETYPRSSHPLSTDSRDAPYSPSLIFDGGTITFVSSQATNGKPPFLHQKGSLNQQ